MRRNEALALTVVALAVLTGCSSGPFSSRTGATPDNEPTLKTLADRKVTVAKDAGVATSEAKALAAYQAFLKAAPSAPQRAEAMRRLGDLEMDLADNRVAGGEASGKPEDYKAAITRYQDYLKAYPNDPKNDRVLYQLARAHEQGGDLATALKTLDALVAAYPGTAYVNEVQFRRGELLFTQARYPQAERAYATVLANAQRTPFHERALYMQGWSQFKQGRLEEGLASFFGVLDQLLPEGTGDAPLAELPGMKRSDRELVEDTFRVTSISLENLQGAAAIPRYTATPARQAYEFRVYQQLAELYLKQDRPKDAADTLGAYAQRHPQNPQAPVMQARVIEIYEQTNFPGLALDAKRQYVVQYGPSSALRTQAPPAWQRAQPLVKGHLVALARHHHAAAQKDKNAADVREATRWYRELLTTFPDDAEAPQQRFLLAELLYDDQRWAEATVEFEKVAYEHAGHPRGADAGYTALLALEAQRKAAAADQQPAVQRQAVASALRFAKAYPADARTAPVLATTTETLFALKDAAQADEVARQLLALQPPAAPAHRRVAWTVLAHQAFDRNDFPAAERGYAEALALLPSADKEADKSRAALNERLAAAVYKQGELARTAGNARDAVGHFNRVATVAPGSAVQANAQYDAAAALVALKDWDNAARTLEAFRARHPNHPLAGDVAAQLAVAYVEQNKPGQAAAEFERVVASAKDPEVSRAALWQAAELHAKAGARPAAVRTYERYVALYPQPLEAAVEARWRLVGFAREDRQRPRETALLKDIVNADRAGGSARNARTQTLAGLATLALAEPVAEEYRQVKLVEPLQRQLKLKKAKLEVVLAAYGQASQYGQAEVTTAATARTAALYADFGQALMTSQRPRGLKKAELEQYNVMLEEQAYPFEEKAIELHQANARYAAQGIYDDGVKQSFEALRTLRPARFAKAEREPSGAAQALLREALEHRRAGRFAQARSTYESAQAQDDGNASLHLNFGVLLDLYLDDAPAALQHYERYLALTPGGDAAVAKWVTEVKSRKPATVASGATAKKDAQP